MSSKIFKAIGAVATSVFVASLIFLLGISYNYFSDIQKDQLKNETELAAQGVNLSGAGYFDNLKAENYRITWLDANGRVLYDNEADSHKMENHLEREEIKQALKEGYGESSRYSDTLTVKQFYSAMRLTDGSVLRLSIQQIAVWTLIFGFFQPICIVIVIAFVVSFLLASQLAKKIVEPINQIDPRCPKQYLGNKNYKEVEPLLKHIASQQMQLKEDQEKIEKLALLRQKFTANVSHELKTPLHAISGYAELIENGMVREKDIIPFASKIRSESSRMTKLVEDTIELTKLDNSGAEIKWENCDFYRISENAVDSLENAASAMGVTISLEGESAPMKAVPQMLYSVVYNLCDNAIKYNHDGGCVKVSIKQSKKHTVLTVSDTGIGIPEACQDKIFERFYRVDKSRSRAVGGTGLGLSIVKHAVMFHNGKTRVKSEEGKGSEFVVIIPNRPAKD